ncbi:aldehyde dehydrogenase (NADP(+)) [Nocardioides lianchengensis]|uniref:NADP-dependent aldehyde dehydrogenase n=1 Tax=Nocardioides lianchengensis TaxID=1045774 RepID=A0A1G6TT10_9ACTN|nr:aldehyde dehydrogenase (NADP(+)) [Nocardioides lianchengensis]NYG11673.1 NADP-dependent aldehyde dehydrogenase [Nocardioides lianchengensis]SDD31465.1 NADP-dependent aldehyde dehydrogenase [Nocardioides lianchengensis]
MTLIQGTDPRTGEPVGEAYAATTPDELEALLAAAAAAAPSYAASEPCVRAGLLRALADRLDENAVALAELGSLESGLPLGRLTGEVGRTSGQLRLFATVVEEGSYLEATLDPAVPTATPPRPDLRRVLVSLGPVLVFGASNFPLAFSVLGGDTASALACGSPVLAKVHDSHPGLSATVLDLAATVVAEQGLPAGVIGAVRGNDAALTALRDPRIKAAGFTGSTHVGRMLFDAASSRPDPIPFFGELGSINPTIVTPSAVAARGAAIVDGYVDSFTLGTGQFCTKPGLLFLPRGHGLADALAARVGAAAPAPLLNARIRTALDDGVAALSAAATRLAGGEDAPAEGSWASPSVFVTSAATVAADPAVAEEVFGPVSVVVEYDDLDDLAVALRSVEGSLTATLHVEDDDSLPLDELVGLVAARAGRVLFNGWPTGVAVSWAQTHGGPWPSTTSAQHTSVGATAIRRWLRPVTFQDAPDAVLPASLRDANPWGLPRRLDGVLVLP